MSSFQHRGVALAALLACAGLQGAHAARLEIVSAGSALDALTHTATVDGVTASREITGHLSGDAGASSVLWTDFQTFGPVPQGGLSVEDGHSHMVAVDASGTHTMLSLDLGHYWASTGQGSIGHYQLAQSLSLDGLRLRVMADGGETPGQAVTVNFAGVASALLSGAADSNDLGLTLDVLRGDSTLASYQGWWSVDATENLSLSFSAAVGDELTVLMSGYQAASLNLPRALTGPTTFGGGVLLSGSFTVTAVPEPQTWSLGLAGLLIASVAARRRR